MDIILQTTTENEQILEQNFTTESIDFQKIESSLWDGEILTNYIIPLSSTIIGSLTTIIVQNIRSRKHVKIIDNGVEVHGVSEKNAKEILETIYANKSKKKSK
ncbi:hypothetical protein B0A80_15725 [Flavobacterium tructae]|uniref:hypothetical protein n=1 Tax=Flavobacterium tructae TaxID=1114873 RepID=UPI000B5B78C0|nr:hypothetical protein [Flavobacterium tructae]OXB22557.1 hypothetical protein B0A80_15725 [Flavobacterium tructae]